MRWAGGLLVVASACYSPSVPAGAPCDPQANNCPAGQRCELTASGAYCSGVPQVDGAIADAPIDVPIDAPAGCDGIGLVDNICSLTLPTTDLDIATDRIVDTAMVGGGNCDQIIAQPLGGAPLCLIAGRSITIRPSATLTGVGPNPLLLIATSTFVIDGTIDVASHISAATPGAGASTTCPSGKGGNGGGGGDAGAGGAGGSFGTVGAGGGDGRNGSNGGAATGAIVPTNLRGGCAGGDGGAGGGGGGAGSGGNGGGAVYVFAGGSLSITGRINASGAAGERGRNADTAGSGGGGGGAGGMIVLDAPAITMTGSAFANGGGGGGGNGNATNNHGSDGKEPAVAETPAAGGNGGSGGGGDGGDGYSAVLPPTIGGDGTSGFCAGGGGGGGGGVIRVFGASPTSLAGTFSPAPT